MLPLFTIAIFLGATLLFVVQPMVGKLILPLLGGSPGVWNTVMLFFQALLLSGYGYAHFIGRFSMRTQLIMHAVLIIAASLMLPIGLPVGDHWIPDPDGFQAGQVLWLLLMAVGAPGLIMCSASPLLQRWFAASGHRSAHDPYFLYAASNAGSMIALLAYPLFIEPAFSLTLQRTLWSWLFGAFVILAMICGICVLRSSRHARQSPRTEASKLEEPDIDERTLSRHRVMWVVLSLVPAGLMMAVTQHITTDIAAVPLLWVLPLAIYLLSFIVAFAKGGTRVAKVCGWILPPVVVGVAVMSIIGLRTPGWLPIGVNLLMLFLAATSCHGRLARLRPPASRLTEFYLLLSVGGVLAGIFCGITAPSLFNGIVEYPLLIVAACLLREYPTKITKSPRSTPHWFRLTLSTTLWILIIGIVPFYLNLMVWLLGPRSPDPDLKQVLFQLCWIVPAALCMLLISRRWMYGAAVLMLLLIPWFDRQLRQTELLQIRTFFGVHRVVGNRGPTGPYHILVHGSTWHGRQWRIEPLDREPMSYYTRSGPVGDIMAELDRRGGSQHIAVIGLGAGTFAAYGRFERAMTFYEIDPVVKDIATNPMLFSYIENSASPIDFVMGDARLTIARAQAQAYDFIAMDAFSSDSVPVHLITREAVAAYLRALKPEGLLLINVSNRHIDFEPVLARLAQDAGLVGRIRSDRNLSPADLNEGKLPSAFIVLVREEADLGSIGTNPNWRPLVLDESVRVWTDDYSDILSVVKWR